MTVSRYTTVDALNQLANGRPDLAVAMLEPTAKLGEMSSQKALASIMRNSLRDYTLVKDFLQDMGWDIDQYHGFNHLNQDYLEKLSYGEVAARHEVFDGKEIEAFIFRDDCLAYSQVFLKDIPAEGETYPAVRFYLRGLNFLSEQKHEKALDNFILAAKIDSLFRQAHLNAGYIFWKFGQIKNALTYFNNALKIPNAQWHNARKKKIYAFMPRFIEGTRDGYSIFYWQGYFFCCNKTRAFILIYLEKIWDLIFKKKSNDKKKYLKIKKFSITVAKCSQELRKIHSKFF